MKFTAHVATHKSGSECAVEFEVLDSELEDLTADERDALLAKEAEQAVYDSAQVEIWWTEGGEEA